MIGEVTDHGELRAFFDGDTVGAIPAEYLTDLCPRYELETRPHATATAAVDEINDQPKTWVFEQYDHLVGSSTVRRPGLDAAVVRIDGKRGLALTLDGPRLGERDPFAAGHGAVYDAALNVACAGGEPLALTDCLNFGDPGKPEIAWELEQAIEGIATAANELGIPVVSGNVSLYNETGGIPIPPTPVVGCVGLVHDITRIPDRWQRGDRVYLLRGSGAELVRFVWQNATEFTLAHDVSDGGLALALREAGAWSRLDPPAARGRSGARTRGASSRCAPRPARPPGAISSNWEPSEMCGVFGVRAPGRDVARLTYFGLYALQHRGQESAGIAVSERGRLTALRDLGLVPQVFNEQNLSGLQGELAIGHTRYSTTGANAWANAQPLLHHGSARTVALGHNGNLVNAAELREAAGKRLASTTDSEMIAALIADDSRPLAEAVAGAMAQIEGAATVVGLADGKLFAFRDRHGFRPLVLGRLGDDTVVASESCALDLVGAKADREVRPGELVLISDEGVETIQAVEPPARGSLCIFEFFYLARPDTRLAGVEIHGARVRMGERLAAESPVEADLVLPIPDSGTPAAIGFARATGIPFSEGLIKNRYVGRTFIQPEQGMREQGIRMKFNPLAEVEGKRLVVVDDSIVRGSTTRQIVAMLFDAGAAEVHIRISSPPVVSPCFYGIDFASEDDLIAAHSTVEEVRSAIGATSLAYLSLDGLQAATRRPESALCRACLTRDYPTRLPTDARKLRFEPTPT